MKVLRGIDRLFTAGPQGTIDDAAVVIDGGSIVWAGPARDAPPGEPFDLGGGLMTPGLVDAHTHPLYAGDRMAEVAARSAGAGYAEIAAAGGGIAATVKATRAATTDSLAAAVRGRLARMAAARGTTTVEAKTGYHLERDGELAAVALLAALHGEPGLPDVAVTFLGAHATPPDRPVDRAAYAEEVASWCGAAASAGARFCDVFCDEGYFTVDETRLILLAGLDAGLVPRVHADELARTGGAQLAAELGAASADHLLCATDEDAHAMARSGVTAVLCPGTALSLGRTPPARLLADAGVTIALGSDHNPGTSGIVDMTLVVALAVAAFGLTVIEALTAATAGGAASLQLADRGVIAPGRRADLVLWDASHEGAFAWAWGVPVRRVWRAGEE